MKTLNQNKAIPEFDAIRESFRNLIESNYETKAKDCLTCDVQGSCCTDTHFVNVHISRLEAVAISKAVEGMGQDIQQRVAARNREAVKALEIQTTEDSFSRSYSCPLFEKGIGCLVHKTAKPLPCINHACYENPEDLPSQELMGFFEKKIDRLNDAVYRKNWNWLPIPEWLTRVL